MSIASFLLSPLLARISKNVESDVADVTERAVIAGASRGMNSAAQKLGLVGVVASDFMPEVPLLVLSPEAVSEGSDEAHSGRVVEVEDPRVAWLISVLSPFSNAVAAPAVRPKADLLVRTQRVIALL